MRAKIIVTKKNTTIIAKKNLNCPTMYFCIAKNGKTVLKKNKIASIHSFQKKQLEFLHIFYPSNSNLT